LSALGLVEMADTTRPDACGAGATGSPEGVTETGAVREMGRAAGSAGLSMAFEAGWLDEAVTPFVEGLPDPVPATGLAVNFGAAVVWRLSPVCGVSDASRGPTGGAETAAVSSPTGCGMGSGVEGAACEATGAVMSPAVWRADVGLDDCGEVRPGCCVFAEVLPAAVFVAAAVAVDGVAVTTGALSLGSRATRAGATVSSTPSVEGVAPPMVLPAGANFVSCADESGKLEVASRL
jgi:hypothetical protein